MPKYLQSLRRVGIVDINAAAQFLQRGGREEPSEARSPIDAQALELAENKTAAFRLFLSHVVIEHGELWIADDETGIQAAALWLPRQPQQFGAEVQRVLVRELGEEIPSQADSVAESAGLDTAEVTSLPRILAIADSTAPDLILTDVVLSPDVDPSTPDGAELVRELLRPVLSSPAHTRFAAISMDTAIVDVLQDLGFRAIATVPLNGQAAAWMGVADFAVHVA